MCEQVRGEKDCRKVHKSRSLEVGDSGEKRNTQSKRRERRWRAKINQHSEPPKLQSPLKLESGSWQNSWWIGLMSEEWNKTQHMSEPEVLGLCMIVPPMDAMCAAGRSCCAARLFYHTRSFLRTSTIKRLNSKMNFWFCQHLCFYGIYSGSREVILIVKFHTKFLRTSTCCWLN